MKYLICLGLSLGLANAAAAQDRSGAYMGASVGSFSYEEEDEFIGTIIDDSATAYRIMGGYRLNDNFAVEGGWGETGDLEGGFTELIPPFGTITLNIVGNYEILTVRALGFLPFERVSLLGGVGYYDADLDATVSVTGLVGPVDASGSDDGATLVGGIEFNLERVDIRAELEWFDVDSGSEAWDASVGVLFHF
jgi:OOP family OmpA-OmpF porin